MIGGVVTGVPMVHTQPMTTKSSTTQRHARQYRVTRVTPGVDWSSQRHTYHRTYGQAREAAAAFFGGAGNYSAILKGQRIQTSRVELAERHEFRGYARYEVIKTWTDSHIV